MFRLMSGWLKTSKALSTSTIGKEEFEIFDLCTSYVNKCYENDVDLFRKVRSSAYEHGIDEEQVLMVYRLELRDYILNIRQENRVVAEKSHNSHDHTTNQQPRWPAGKGHAGSIHLGSRESM